MDVRQKIAVVLAVLPIAGCSVSIERDELSASCLAAMTTEALRNPRTNTIIAPVAGPLGLASSSDQDAPPFISKQVEFPGGDGAMHYFAVGGPQWQRAALMRVETTGSTTQITIFAINPRGELLAAGEYRGGPLTVLNVSDATVRSRYQTEVSLWRVAARATPSAAGACR